jgi:hypothetical protein
MDGMQRRLFLEVTETNSPHRLLEPPIYQNQWLFSLRKSDAQEGAWIAAYQWGDNDFTPVLLPAFIEVGGDESLDKVGPLPDFQPVL